MSGKKRNPGNDMPDMPSDADLDAVLEQIDQFKSDAEHAGDDAPAHDAPAKEDEPTEKQQIETLKAEMTAMKDQALRAMADSENVKRRAEKEVAAAKLYGIERFANDILSVYDNLGRALLTLDGKAREDMGDNAKNLLQGIELTEKDLMAIFARHGIKAVPGKGEKFDPNVHQAVAQIPSDEEKGYIAEVMQTGFKIGERTLRAAMVAVSTGPQKS